MRYLFIPELGAPTNGIFVERWGLTINDGTDELQDMRRVIHDRELKRRLRAPQTGFAMLDFSKEDVPNYSLTMGMRSLCLSPTFAKVGAYTGTVKTKVWMVVHCEGRTIGAEELKAFNAARVAKGLKPVTAVA